MTRRTVLGWLARGLYAGCAAAVAVPALRFLTAPLSKNTGGTVRGRAVQLAQLKPGEPRLAAIRGPRSDAWTRFEDEIVGRVWVVRTSPAGVPPDEVRVDVFSSVCPHNGCQVREAGSAGGGGDTLSGYLCPCHNARFAADGSPAPLPGGRPNPSPRGLDPLDHAVVRDDDTGRWWIEVEYRNFEIGTAERVPV